MDSSALNNLVVCLCAGVALGAVVIYIVYATVFRKQIEQIKKDQEALSHREEKLKIESENSKKEAVLAAREEAISLRAEIDKEQKEKKAEIQRQERKLAQKEESLDKRLENLDRKEKSLAESEKQIKERRAKADELVRERDQALQKVAGLSAEEARDMVIAKAEKDMERHVARIIRNAEEQANEEAEKTAKNIIVTAIQRCAVEQAAESTVSVVPLPSEEMKGRIIGREGRNIRTFETLTGVDLIVDDTPEAVVISGFDAVRREIAGIALKNLIVDGRIHPGRIEETVEKATKEVNQKMKEAADKAIFETGVTGLDSELVKLLGRLRFRTSYGQNMLQHSVEVSHLAGSIAAELGVNVSLARRAGLLHDLGKALDSEIEKPHAIISMDVLLKYRESRDVAEAAGAHHWDIEPKTAEAVIVQAADAISASRPGARRETLETYVKRLQKLETIADSYPGVDKAYAVQAGREIRVMVKPSEVDDEKAVKLAYDTARKIESEMDYPGQIKVTVIREVRSTDYAK
ncbi:MAG: ribonuclease Y [Abditibacteriota bacterium]|nr:ribonuclease Y [Abditibacteriota bacterium]